MLSASDSEGENNHCQMSTKVKNVLIESVISPNLKHGQKRKNFSNTSSPNDLDVLSIYGKTMADRSYPLFQPKNELGEPKTTRPGNSFSKLNEELVSLKNFTTGLLLFFFRNTTVYSPSNSKSTSGNQRFWTHPCNAFMS
ncbi:hypothetical protein V6N11_014365 [Hibiscus sabdariffa]|uniref:Uncharacterized protein n=1 Tax=Hibiscus sabdariffa TaxID=183260 RepID=A0ABR2AAC6_9ROSI